MLEFYPSFCPCCRDVIDSSFESIWEPRSSTAAMAGELEAAWPANSRTLDFFFQGEKKEDTVM